MKLCKKCGITKSEADFSNNRHMDDGLSIWCKSCNKEYKKSYQFNHKKVSVKLCGKCGETKENIEFFKNQSMGDGLSNWCKSCSKKYRKEHKPQTQEHAKKVRVLKRCYSFKYKKELRHQSKIKRRKQKINKEQLEKNKIMRETLSLKDYRKNDSLRQRYGITLKEYNEMLHKQNGVCAICGKGPGKRSLHVDHCHKTGKVRALLCNNCNHVVGAAEKSLITLNEVFSYLETYQ